MNEYCRVISARPVVVREAIAMDQWISRPGGAMPIISELKIAR